MRRIPATGEALHLALAVFITLAVMTPPARAHSLRLWVRAAKGSTIEGRAYFPGGGRARHVTVEVLGPDGARLGTTETDDRGEFTFRAQRRCDHRFVVQSPDGHGAEATVEAGSLPDDLPGASGEGRPAETVEAEVKPDGARAAGEKPPAGASAPEGGLRAVVDAAVARHVEPLSRKLEALQSQRRLQDVLGGIGYIVGATGVGFYFLAARKRSGKRPRSE